MDVDVLSLQKAGSTTFKHSKRQMCFLIKEMSHASSIKHIILSLYCRVVRHAFSMHPLQHIHFVLYYNVVIWLYILISVLEGTLSCTHNTSIIDLAYFHNLNQSCWRCDLPWDLWQTVNGTRPYSMSVVQFVKMI